MIVICSSIVVSEDLVLNNGTGETVQALCVGEAGCGKTTLAKRLTWLWAKGQQSSPFWEQIKMVIFVASENEDVDFHQTLRNSIPGKEAYKDSAMDLMKDEPESVLVIVEAFEEFQNNCIIKGIQQMIRNGATNMLLTVRKDHPCITAKFLPLFTQLYQIEGFIPKEAASFVQRFLTDIGCQYDVQEFLQAIDGKAQFETNPLNLTLACQLYAEGELKTSDMETLTEVKLYAMREARLIERECEKQQVGTEDVHSEIQKVQNLALYCLFKRKMHCLKSELENFKIEHDSPVMVLLEKRKTSSAAHGHQENWTWAHSRLLEFDGAMALSNIQDFKDSLWLHWLANRPDLNQTAQMLTVLLVSNESYNVIKHLTIASIILQSRAECTASPEQTTTDSHPCHQIKAIKHSLKSEMTDEVCFSKGKCKPLTTNIEMPDLETLQKCCGSLYAGNVSLFLHVQHCWQLGLSKELHKDFVLSYNALLLPAVDTYVNPFH